MCPWLIHTAWSMTRTKSRHYDVHSECPTCNGFGKELVLDFLGNSVRHDDKKEEKEREKEKKERAFQEQLASFIRVHIGRNVVRPISRVRLSHDTSEQDR